MKVLKTGTKYIFDVDVDVIAFHYVVPQPSPTCLHPQTKGAKAFPPYWEGKLANGKCVQLEKIDIDNDVRKFYADVKKLKESDFNGLVAVSKNYGYFDCSS